MVLPAAPGNVTCSSSTGSSQGAINVSWTVSSGVSQYQLYRDISGSNVLVGTFNVGINSNTDTGLVGGSPHNYTVRPYAQNSSGITYGNYSNTTPNINAASLPPTPNTPSPSASANSTSSINISWAAIPSSGGDPTGTISYNIYRSGSFLTSTSSTSYTDSGLAAGTNYSYGVIAICSNSVGSSGSNSGSASATTYLPAPNAPGSVASISASTNGPGGIYISWSGASGASGYFLYRDNSYATSIAGTSYSDSGLAEGSNHSYYVVPYASGDGVNTSGTTTGPQSSSASGTAGITTPPPSAPNPATNLSADGFKLTWTGSVGGASGYYIYRNGNALTPTGSTAYTDTSPPTTRPVTYVIYAYNSNAGGTTYASASNTATVGGDSVGILSS
jgi:hypothetical protein